MSRLQDRICRAIDRNRILRIEFVRLPSSEQNDVAPSKRRGDLLVTVWFSDTESTSYLVEPENIKAFRASLKLSSGTKGP